MAGQLIEVQIFQAKLVIEGVTKLLNKTMAMQLPIYKEEVRLHEYEDKGYALPLGKVLGLTLDASKRLNKKGWRPDQVGYTDYDNDWFYLEDTDDGLAWYKAYSIHLSREIKLRSQIPTLIL